MQEEKFYYNALAIMLDGDRRKLAKLKKRFPDWKSAYEGSLDDGRSPPDIALAWKDLERAGVQLILFDDDGYPALLREIHDPPFGIYVLGTLPKETGIAIVGTRRGSPGGKEIAKSFARELASVGFVIVSGLALGIDAAAHEGCLESANGKTIAVLAGGLASIYPATNERLARKILGRGGAIISEYPLKMNPLPYRFLERNRIVSGLSKGTLVVECPKESGSLATARFALEQNRDVFVIPGPITHPNFFGSHSLIRQGAELVTKYEDILEAYDMIEAHQAAREELASNDEERQVLVALRNSSTPLDIDKLIEITRLEPRIANQTLSFLLIKNVIKELDSGYIIE